MLKSKHKLTLILIVFLSTFVLAQEKWEFANSTPKETVKSHLYFLEREHYDITLASYTLGGKLPQSEKQQLSIKLKDILLKHKINVDEVLDRKKGIVEKNKYVLFSDMPKIYLVRINRTWQYSEETVSNINLIYKDYYLNLQQENNFQLQLKQAAVEKKILKPKKNSTSKVTETEDSDFIEEVVLDVDLSTPYNTIVSHLLFLEDSLYRPDLAAKTINFKGYDTLYAEELAIKLKQIYLGTNKHVFNINELSTDSNFVDTVSGKNIYYPNPALPELYLEKIGDNWLYSNATSKLINSVHKDMYSEDADAIFNFSDRFKKWAKGNNNTYLLDLKLWQIYMFIYFIIIGIFLYLINLYVVRFLFNKIFKNSRYTQITYKIFIVSGFTIFWYYTKSYIPSFALNIDAMGLMNRLVSVAIIFNYTLLSIYIVNFLKIRFTKNVTASTQGLIIFMALIVKTIIFVTSLLFIIKAIDFNIVNVLAGLSIGGFAIALGAQDTIKNFFGSLMIFADKQFSVGDWISSDKVSGTVEEVGLRTTKIRTFHNSVVVVPNSQLADNSLDNMGRREYRRYKGVFVIKFDTPTEIIEEFIQKIREEIKNRQDTRKDFYMVYINDFSTYGLEIMVYVFFKVPDWDKEMKGKHELIRKILDFAKELNIEFAIPPK